MASDSAFETTDDTAINSAAERLFSNAVILGPMVRANSVAFRALCLQHGVHTVFSEEIIDKRLLKCQRVENKSLNTVDFVVDKTVLFRTDPGVEKGHLVLQLGTSDPQSALRAAQIVEGDVDGIDINMGVSVRAFSVIHLMC